MKVLTVDDALIVRTMLRNILEQESYDVEEAENGVIALEKLKAGNQYDIILLDWEMPEMNGYEFLQAYVAENLKGNTKVIMLTSLTKMSNILKAIDAGADDYIMKPFTPDIILEKIESVTSTFDF